MRPAWNVLVPAEGYDPRGRDPRVLRNTDVLDGGGFSSAESFPAAPADGAGSGGHALRSAGRLGSPREVVAVLLPTDAPAPHHVSERGADGTRTQWNYAESVKRDLPFPIRFNLAEKTNWSGTMPLVQRCCGFLLTFSVDSLPLCRLLLTVTVWKTVNRKTGRNWQTFRSLIGDFVRQFSTFAIVKLSAAL